MIKQDFVLTELDALAKDMGTLVSEELKLLEEKREMYRKRESGQPVMASLYNPNKFMAEIEYFQRRLEAIRIYLARETIDPL